MANKKGAGGVMRGTSVGVALLFERGKVRRSQLAAAECTEQHRNLMETAPAGDKATAPS